MDSQNDNEERAENDIPTQMVVRDVGEIRIQTVLAGHGDSCSCNTNQNATLIYVLLSSIINNCLITDKTLRLSKYRLQHCLEWVMRVYTSKLTPNSVVTYLFHDCERSLWLFCQLVWHVRAIIKVHCTPWLTARRLQFCTCAQCLRDKQSFASYRDFVFVPVCWFSRRESSG